MVIGSLGDILLEVFGFDHQAALMLFQFEAVNVLMGWEEPRVKWDNLANFVAFGSGAECSCTTEMMTHKNALLRQLKVGPVGAKLLESVFFVDLFNETRNFFASLGELLVPLFVALVSFSLTVKIGTIGREISTTIIMSQTDDEETLRC